LTLAASHASASIVEQLIARGVDLDRPNKQGDTALIIACCKGSDVVVQALLAGGANPSLLDATGVTAEERARYSGKWDIAEKLLAAQALRAP
jgi:ankyrin repeat protein